MKQDDPGKSNLQPSSLLNGPHTALYFNPGEHLGAGRNRIEEKVLGSVFLRRCFAIEMQGNAWSRKKITLSSQDEVDKPDNMIEVYLGIKSINRSDKAVPKT
ncbi:hypothetical protein NPIL_441 [Nephila pilipes]|uniref:Uncharacterized protein n=1 Tax=Nephila pilipes TaxID=299642 RepID=A0A8X6QS48_NEPPI|nr:hypothetical protein NPIL_441 [Nephila pilipes]